MLKLETIFGNAIQIESPDERAAYLDQACGDNTELRNETGKLVNDHFRAGAFLDHPAVVPTVEMPSTVNCSGTQIGPYTLREQIGEGGFGVVFVAEQQHPVARKVALKIVKPGMDTKEVIARFEAERQALALMEHPNIAKVLDAGALKSGRPFFVMELVKGVPITDFCDDEKLSTRERLQLFADVCRAVQHAHQKGIIHRDLKPSNVMVTVSDGKPVPKVIDFGIAKALSQKLTDCTVYTAYGQMIGTPLYMSPEQATMSMHDVDTRSDVYSLGVLLYKLLTGSTPFDRKTLNQAGFDEVRRIIREDDPPRPSARISTLQADTLSTISDKRRIDSRKLGRSLRGELDWIVMKSLEKDRNRRYESASALAADVERYLGGEPVQACPPSIVYRLKKFGMRNKGVLTTAGLVATTLLMGTVVSTWLAIDAYDARSEAEQNSRDAEQQRNAARQAVDDMYVEVAEKWLAHQPKLTDLEKTFLEKALSYYQELASQRSDDPVIEFETAQAWRRVGDLHDKLGRHKSAESAFIESRSRLEQLASRFPQHADYRRELARTCNNMGAFFAVAQRRRDAETMFRKALELRTRLEADSADDSNGRHELATSFANVGALLSNDPRRAREAESLLKSASRIWEDLAKNSVKDKTEYRAGLAMTHHGLAHVAKNSQRTQDAEILFRKSIHQSEQLLKNRPRFPGYRQKLALSLSDLGEMLAEIERDKSANEYLSRAIGVFDQLVAEFPDVLTYQVQLATAHSRLSIAFKQSERFAPAIQSARKAVAVRKAILKARPDSPPALVLLGGSLSNLALVLREDGKLEEARDVAREAIRHQQAALKAIPGNTQVLTYLRNHYWVLTETLLRLGDHAAAAASAEELPKLFPDSWKEYDRAARFLLRCAMLARDDGQLESAERRTLRSAYESRSWNLWRDAAARNPDSAAGQNRIARFLATCPDVRFRDPHVAVAFAEKAAAAHNKNSVYQNTLGIAYYRAGDLQKAVDALTRSTRLPDGAHGFNWLFLAMAEWRLGHKTEARRFYDVAVACMPSNAAEQEVLLRFRVEAEELMGIKKRPVRASRPRAARNVEGETAQPRS